MSFSVGIKVILNLKRFDLQHIDEIHFMTEAEICYLCHDVKLLFGLSRLKETFYSIRIREMDWK